jgi:SAM-dependent methyltransferase
MARAACNLHMNVIAYGTSWVSGVGAMDEHAVTLMAEGERMMVYEYEYRDLMAQAWDVLRGDTSKWEDRSFYLDVIRRWGEPVLDVGCGTGRLLLDYLGLGIDVDGVDNSPEMLALCRQKAAALGLEPVLHEQYVERLSLPRRYRTILVPSSSLQLVVELAAADEAVGRLHDHLLADGMVAASIMTLWQPGDPLTSEWETSALRAEDGATFRRVARSWYEPELECEHTEDVYQMILDGQVVAEETHRRSPATRSYTQAQARALFERAGFESVELYHEFTFEPVRAEDTLFCVIARRA